MRTLALVLLICVLGVSLTAQAGVIATDLETVGDGLLTYDTINKREWLDLPETGGVRLAEVMAQMGPGGRLEGFQFAMLEDVSELVASAEINWMEAWTGAGTTGDHVYGFVNQLGWVIQMTGGILGEVNVALGLIASDFANGVPNFDNTNFYVVSVGEWLDPDVYKPPLYARPTGGVFIDGPISFPNFPDLPPMGTGDLGPFWLYRAVPEPGALAIILVAAAVFTCRRNFGEH